MKRGMIIRPDAERDVAEAYQWYEEQRMGLGSDFIVCFQEGLAKIQSSPAAYPIVYKKVHRLLIRRFPYGIFYIIERDLIVVLAVFHERRDPSGWQSRV